MFDIPPTYKLDVVATPPVLQSTTNLLGVVWAVMMLAVVWLLPDAPRALVAVSLFFPIYYALLSFWLHARRRASS